MAKYLTVTTSGAHVKIEQSADLAQEITYNLSGTSSDGEFYMSGSYKATLALNGLTLTNKTPVTSGAAIHIQNGKRIKVKVMDGTVIAIGGLESGASITGGTAMQTSSWTANTWHALYNGGTLVAAFKTPSSSSSSGGGSQTLVVLLVVVVLLH